MVPIYNKLKLKYFSAKDGLSRVSHNRNKNTTHESNYLTENIPDIFTLNKYLKAVFLCILT